MEKLILRWTYGQIKDGYNSKQGLELLEYSIKFAVMIFPKKFQNIQYYVCYNNLNSSALKRILKISKKNNIQLINVSDILHERLRNNTIKNSWWKYAIPRIDKNSYEIIIDSDVILWEIPEILHEAINNDALIALTDGKGKFYGDYKTLTEQIDQNLKLNAGLIGFPMNFSLDLKEIIKNPPNDYFFSEQGFTALNYAKYDGKKYQIPLSDIQQLNINRISATDLLLNYKGGHFCGCNYGPEDYWAKIYKIPIKRKFKKMIE